MKKVTSEKIKEFVSKLIFNEQVILDKDTSWPKISIVTPSFNQARFLEKTILSVLNQNYPHLEYIIMDGGSTDGSAEIIEKYKTYLAYGISQKDNGQADAIHKGFNKSTGEILAWLNSDDLLAPDALFEVANWFRNNPNKNWVTGGCIIIDQNDTMLSNRYGMPLYNLGARVSFNELLYFGHPFNQSSCFFRKTFFYAVGGFNTDLIFSFDYDLFLRFSHKERSGHIKNIISYFRYHADSKTSTLVKTREKEDQLLRSIHREKKLFRLLRVYYLIKYYIKRIYLYANFLRSGRQVKNRQLTATVSKNHSSKQNLSRPLFLAMLYGSMEYDGRAQRLLELIKTVGNVSVVDVGVKAGAQSVSVYHKRSVKMPARAGIVQRHLRFWQAALAETLRQRPKVVVGANFFTTIPACVAATLIGAKFVYDAYELIIPEPPIKMGWRDRFWYYAERLVVRRADLVIAANEERAHMMQEHYGLPYAPVVMRNIPPRRESLISEETIFRSYPELARRSPEERLVIYQGNVDFSRGIDRFVLALAHLPLAFRMVVVGDGPDLQRLRAIGRSFEHEGRLSFLGRVENQILPSTTVMADVGIITYPFLGQNNIYCAPNKVFEYAQAGLPVVSTNQPPLRRLVENYNIGELVGPDDDYSRLAEAIRRVADNRQRYSGGLMRLLADHQWEDEAKRVRAAIEKFLNLPKHERSNDA